MVRVMEWRRAYVAMNLERGTRIGILMPNSIDHACADQAALANGLVPVPLHAIDTPAPAPSFFPTAGRRSSSRTS